MQTLMRRLWASSLLFTIVGASFQSSANATPAKPRVVIESLFAEGSCPADSLQLLKTARALLTSKSTPEKLVDGWLKEELTQGVDLTELNWVRAVNPWLLPKNFPARTAFTECASHLRTFSDARENHSVSGSEALAMKSLEDWRSCLRLVFPKGYPPEFQKLSACLK